MRPRSFRQVNVVFRPYPHGGSGGILGFGPKSLVSSASEASQGGWDSAGKRGTKSATKWDEADGRKRRLQPAHFLGLLAEALAHRHLESVAQHQKRASARALGRGDGAIGDPPRAMDLPAA